MKYLSNKLFCAVLIFSAVLSSSIGAAPPNLTAVKKELQNYHDSGLYQKELSKVITKAQNYIDQEVALNQTNHKKLAIVLDIDETSLSNYRFMVHRDFGGSKELYHKDILKANAPAIKSTLALYKDALLHGVQVFFVTGRNESERQATEKNLINSGYTTWNKLYLRPLDYSNKSIIPFKCHTRKLITQKGYTIVASIGDQYSDLKGGYAQKVFKLPNPFYYLP